MAYLRFLVGYLVLALGALPLCVLLVLLLPFRVARIRWGLACGAWICRGVLGCLGVKVVFDGVKPHDLAPAIFVANHSSTLDLFLFAVSVPVGTTVVVKKEIVAVPIVGQIAWLSGNLLIDRGNLERAKDGLSDVATIVNDCGLSLFIMPEGTRSQSNEIQTFKRGFVHLAIATGLPVVPLVFHGAARRWPMGSFKVRPGTVRIEVLPAISSDGWSSDKAGDIAEDVRGHFLRALDDDGT